jgi:NTP pyrophosphatase (non-canonical NTP hydrolase)
MPYLTALADECVRGAGLGREDFKDPGAMGLKLMEEVGEFAEAINFALGNLPHKKVKESPFGEAADVVQCVIALLVKTYPQMDNERIIEELYKQMVVKNDKYEKKVIEPLRKAAK